MCGCLPSARIIPVVDADQWAEALSDPAFVAALDEGMADVAAGRVVAAEEEPA